MESSFQSAVGMAVAAVWVSLACGCTSATAGKAESLVPVLLETEMGRIEITLDLEHAPVSAGDFLRYVDRGLYEGAGFYRVVRSDNDHGSPPIEVVQGGLLEESDSLPPVEHETTETTGIRHTDGVVSLARSAPGTGGGAAFFIVIGDQPALDFGGTRNPDGLGFAAFGRVTRGMDVVRTIHALDATGAADSPYVEGQILADPVMILRASRIESRDER